MKTLRLLPLLLLLALGACDRSADSGEPCSSEEEAHAQEIDEASGEAAPDGHAASTELVVYSGRSEAMVSPLIAAFEEETGIDVRVNYAGSSQLAATLLEEGDRSPADVFFAQDASTMGLIAAEGMLAPLGDAANSAPEHFRDPEGRWVGVSGRARSITFNTNNVAVDQLPASLDGFLAPEWKGRVGWAPENASFQSALAAMVALDGAEAATAWVTGMLANEARPFPSNTPGVTAVAAGEIDAMITNHYYLYRIKAEQGPDTPIENHFLRNGRSGSLVNISAVGILNTAENRQNADLFVAYLLSPVGQTHFAEENAEFPVTAGVATPQGLPSITELAPPRVDFAALADLEAAVMILQTAGAL
ncbi:MAG: iron(III) transport system substrate-binding protein [Bradymonadia bacterium]|jgi:iron(III) transport system substrate-binding protein